MFQLKQWLQHQGPHYSIVLFVVWNTAFSHGSCGHVDMYNIKEVLLCSADPNNEFLNVLF